VETVAANSRNSHIGIWAGLDDNRCMHTVTLGEAQKHLPELVRQLGREGELLITDAEKPVAKLSSVTEHPSLRDLKPKSIGAVLRPFPSPEDDMLGEMRDARQ
jgi:antitoxin (DNA-binding transcriptional repressor) of toxin-antitoxin stability system